MPKRGKRSRSQKGYWIKHAVKHPGALVRWAEDNGLMTQRGTINLRKAKAFCGSCGLKKGKGPGTCHCSTTTQKRITLATTLRRLNA